MRFPDMKALCFFDADKGRDVEILMPVLFFAEKYLNIKVEKAFIFDIDKIRRKKPDLVIIANAIGSNLHHQIVKYAYENNIKVFALISEGNFKTDGSFRYWGYNTDKKFYQEFICLWSQRTLDFLATQIPQYKHKMVLTGATGFDRYKIYKFETKEHFLERYNLSHFKKVVGYAGWAFGKMYNPTGLKEIRNAYKDKADERMKWMKQQQKLVEDILRKAVENNPDTLFILKRHPSEMHPHLRLPDNNEMVKLADYQNVLYLRNEEDVHTLINVSDIWTAFESTPVIEAWLMKNTPTVFINPDPDFKRDMNYKGTVIVKNYSDFQAKIDEFYSTGSINEMFDNEKIEARNEIIKNVIGFADGMNHIRAGFYLQKTIENIPQSTEKKKVKFNLKFFLQNLFTVVASWFYIKKIYEKLPKIKKHIWIIERHKLKNIEPLKQKYYSYLSEFHEKNKDEIQNLLQNLQKNYNLRNH
jgi:hypothetical protein